MAIRKKILAYQINGQKCGIDINTWYNDDLNGNSPFKIIKVNDEIPNGYADVSSIYNWHKYGISVANDYSVVKFSIKDICDLVGWSGLTNDEKDLAIQYFSYPDSNTAVIYLMTEKGMVQNEAIQYLTLEWHKHHLKTIEAFTIRWNYAKLTVLSYIARLDGEDLFNTVKPLVDLYTNVGVLGKDFNDNQDGLYDYIYSINGFDGNGLEENNYTLLQGTWEDFKRDLEEVLVCGVYEKYDN